MTLRLKSKASPTVQSSHDGSETPRVRSLNTTTSLGLIVAEIGYSFVHTFTFMITLKMWNSFNIYYLIMYVAEETPNFYNFLVCASVFLDQYLPQNITADKAQL